MKWVYMKANYKYLFTFRHWYVYSNNTLNYLLSHFVQGQLSKIRWYRRSVDVGIDYSITNYFSKNSPFQDTSLLCYVYNYLFIKIHRPNCCSIGPLNDLYVLKSGVDVDYLVFESPVSSRQIYKCLGGQLRLRVF